MPKVLSAVVLDASVIAKLLIKEEDSSKAAALFNYLYCEEKLIAEPNFLKIEIYSLARKKLTFKEINQPQAKKALTLFKKLNFNYFQADPHLLDSSFKLAEKLDQPVIYDCLYLALAKIKKADFITADIKFLKKAKVIYSKSFGLSEYP